MELFLWFNGAFVCSASLKKEKETIKILAKKYKAKRFKVCNSYKLTGTIVRMISIKHPHPQKLGWDEMC